MEMKQIATFTNNVVKEVIGDSAIIQEDLSNVVDIGTAIFNAGAFDAYVKTLINHTARLYLSTAPTPAPPPPS